MSATDAAPQDANLTRTAVGLAVATVIAWAVLAAIDHDGPGWILFPVLGAATAVTAYRAGGTTPRNMAALVAFVVGVVAILVFLAWMIFGS
jgi:uncharacterized membrane protein YhdT